MLSKLAADAVVFIHFAFILFVVLGAFLAFRWQRVIWLHLACVLWAITIMFVGFICPLTPLENRLRMAAGESGYSGGFIDRYLMPIIYPSELDRPTQVQLGLAVILINVAIYSVFLFKRKRNAGKKPPSS